MQTGLEQAWSVQSSPLVSLLHILSSIVSALWCNFQAVNHTALTVITSGKVVTHCVTGILHWVLTQPLNLAVVVRRGQEANWRRCICKQFALHAATRRC